MLAAQGRIRKSKILDIPQIIKKGNKFVFENTLYSYNKIDFFYFRIIL